MAINTYGTTLQYGATESLGSTIEIKSFPSILADRSNIETTTLSDDAKTYISGIRQTPESFPFTCNWDKTVFDTINALTAEQYLKLTLPDGSYFTWTGRMSASNGEGSVDAVLEMTVSVTASTVPEFTAGA